MRSTPGYVVVLFCVLLWLFLFIFIFPASQRRQKRRQRLLVRRRQTLAEAVAFVRDNGCAGAVDRKQVWTRANPIDHRRRILQNLCTNRVEIREHLFASRLTERFL